MLVHIKCYLCHIPLSVGNLMGPVLPVEGVDATSLEAVVSSFYTGECPVTTSTVAGILDAAIKLEVTALIEACANFVRTTISPDNCCTLLESSIKYRVGSLAETCMEYLQPRYGKMRISTMPEIRHLLTQLLLLPGSTR